MIKSMTGYGKGEVATESGRMSVEIRSVNHRYGEISVKLPRGLLAFENDVKKCVAERLKRGKIEIYVQREGALDAASRPTVNLPLAKAYFEALKELKGALGVFEPVSLQLVAAQRDVISTGEVEAASETLQADLLSAVEQAVDALEEMRQREGGALLADLQSRRENLGALVGRIAERAPATVVEGAARLKERVAQLLADTTLDEGRLVQEIAIMADRSDITEELVRFDSHLRQFDSALQLAEPVGRKLDFLLQELNREVNTIGSKGGDMEITAMVVELKAELEKIREQVQNIE
jgi:uncharacterized protein (TIGR00255 family)